MKLKLSNEINPVKDYISHDGRVQLDAVGFIMEFVSLQMALALCQMGAKMCYYPHEWFMAEFMPWATEYIEKMAVMLRDFVVFITATEMRHAQNYGTLMLKDESVIYENALRSSIWDGCKKYTPESIMRAGLKIFNPFASDWSSSFGGYKWWCISNALTLYNGPKETFIDHCVDLQHNGTYMFNKEAGIFHWPTNGAYNIKEILDYKKDGGMTDKILSFARSKELQEMILRAQNLRIIFPNGIQSYESSRHFMGEYEYNDENFVILPMDKKTHFYIDDLFIPYGDWIYGNGNGKTLSMYDIVHRYIPVEWGSEDIEKLGYLERESQRSNTWEPITDITYAWSCVPAVSGFNLYNREMYSRSHPEVRKIVGDDRIRNATQYIA